MSRRELHREELELWGKIAETAVPMHPKRTKTKDALRVSKPAPKRAVEAMPKFERIMIETALAKTSGKRQDAAKLLGWGRNTLTRKIKELGME